MSKRRFGTAGTSQAPRQLRSLAPLATALSWHWVGASQGQETNSPVEKAVSELQKIGGQVYRDETRADRPCSCTTPRSATTVSRRSKG
jgi:hypothetical protein